MDEQEIAKMEAALQDLEITGYDGRGRPITREEYLQKIEQAQEEMRQGKGYSTEEVMKAVVLVPNVIHSLNPVYKKLTLNKL